jgi:hypothetical protein
VPDSREQIVAEQARLEHERARLERELQMWQDNGRRTGERLAAVLDRLAMLASASEQAAGAPGAGRPRRQGQQDQDGEEAEPTTTWHEIVLEY